MKTVDGSNPFTQDEQRAIRIAAAAVWMQISDEMISANDGNALRRDQVIEIVCDSNRLESEVRKTDEYLAKKIKEAEPVFVMNSVKPAFTQARYGR